MRCVGLVCINQCSRNFLQSITSGVVDGDIVVVLAVQQFCEVCCEFFSRCHTDCSNINRSSYASRIIRCSIQDSSKFCCFCVGAIFDNRSQVVVFFKNGCLFVCSFHNKQNSTPITTNQWLSGSYTCRHINELTDVNYVTCHNFSPYFTL